MIALDRLRSASTLPATAERRGGRTPVIAIVLIAAALLTVVVFHAGGGRWFVVRTPSMGSAAPVGTLVVTRPAAVTDLHVGDVISFHPPTEPRQTYTHRVHSIGADGIVTKGDINGATDPWTLHQRDLIGRSVAIVPGIGWLLRALPLLLIGSLVVLGLSRLWVAPRYRGPVNLLGLSLVFTLASLVLRPFVRVVQLTTTTSPDGTARVSMVSTGLLPVRVAALSGHGVAAPLDLRTGEVGVVRLSHAPAGGRFELAAHLHPSPTGWILLVVLWSVPLVWAVLTGLRGDGAPAPAPRHRAARRSAAVTA